jgi:GT2 family glycosyltransferase
VDDSIHKIKKFISDTCNILSKPYGFPIRVLEYQEDEFNAFDSYEKFERNNNDLIILKNIMNYGFAKGNNIGIKFALRVLNPEYVLLLNNDTYVKKNFLNELINATGGQKKVGIYSPKLLNADNHEKIDSTGHIFSWGRIVDRGYGKVDKGQFDDENRVIGAKGAAALYKREMLESIGLLKEKFITSYEDAEFSWRAMRNSWKAVYVPTSIVYHKGERSTTKDISKLAYYRSLSMKNMTLTVKEYGTVSQRISYTFLLIYYMITSFVLRLTNIRNSGINYIYMIKKLYE